MKEANEIIIRSESNEIIASLLKHLINEQKETNRLISELLNSNQAKKDYLTHSEASSFLGISPSTLYDMVSEHRIKCRKIGGRNLYRLDDLEMLIEDRK
ncbi:MAG: helix-turn-helix domain-containing protein [Candidatus Omnitrophica bacterium]|nr:helix-turn-helix domain-containing protein [Candidatus Omnitrophota bacterium]